MYLLQEELGRELTARRMREAEYERLVRQSSGSARAQLAGMVRDLSRGLRRLAAVLDDGSGSVEERCCHDPTHRLDGTGLLYGAGLGAPPGVSGVRCGHGRTQAASAPSRPETGLPRRAGKAHRCYRA